MAADRPVLELDRVTGGYGGAEVIHEVSITLGNAEIVTLIGPNGAGKSSAMNAVLGTSSSGAGGSGSPARTSPALPPSRWCAGESATSRRPRTSFPTSR